MIGAGGTHTTRADPLIQSVQRSIAESTGTFRHMHFKSANVPPGATSASS
jgi:hypothetical protein